MDIRSSLLFTEIYHTPDQFDLPSEASYLYEPTAESRSRLGDRFSDLPKTCRINSNVSNGFSYQIGGRTGQVALRSQNELGDFASHFSAGPVYLDISGIEQKVWIPILRALLNLALDLRVVYAEPQAYSFSPSPTEGELFDLTSEDPDSTTIPGFADISGTDDDDSCFVPLLGFEGTRLAYLIEKMQPSKGSIFPIIGVPGFGIEYPFYTYLGNKLPLAETGAWKDAKYAPAECPFRAFYLLEEIAQENAGRGLRVAPIGTKPHALAAALFKLVRGSSVELVYDNRVHKSTGTQGISKVMVYRMRELYNQRIGR